MDVSSDDSFAWTNASHVSSDSDSMPSPKVLNGHSNMTPKKKNSKAIEETTIETNKPKKRKLNQSIETDSDDNRNPKKKKIKTEILSDESSLKTSKHRIVFEKSDDETDLGVQIKTEELSASETSYSKPKKKKHKKHKSSISLNESEDLDETYLNLRAKQEIITNSKVNNTTKVKKAKKNKKSEESFLTNGYEADSDQYLDVKVKEEPDLSDSTIKSKKKKKSKLSVSSNLENEQNLEESYLDIKVKEEENSFKKKSKKKKHSIDDQHSSDVDNSTNRIPDEITSDMASFKNKKNRKSESSSKEDYLESLKKSKKSKKDKYNQEEIDQKCNESSIIENYKSDVQQTPVKLNHKKKHQSISSYSDEDRHIEIKDHVFKTPQATSKLTEKRPNNKNLNDKSLGNKSQITKNTRISDVISSYDSSDDDSPTENTRMSATNMSISPIINQTISNRRHSLSGDSSNDDNEVQQDRSSIALKSPVKKQSDDNVSKRTVNRSNSSDKEKSPIPASKCPQNKKQSSKSNLQTTISKEHCSESSSEEDENKSPVPVSKSVSNKQPKRTVSKSKHSSDEESSYDERSKSPTPAIKSPNKKSATSNTSKRTISDSSDEDSSVDNNNKSVVKSPSKNSANHTRSEAYNPVEDRNNSETKSPKKQPDKKTASDDSSNEDSSSNKPVAQPKTIRSRRITDRIVFEQDDSDVEQDIFKTRLQQFLKTNSNLHPITQKSTSNSVITDDDEIWILKCPSEVNVKTLKNSDILLDKKCKFKMNGETYLGSIDNDVEKVAVTSYEQNKFIIKNVPINGMIHIKKRVPKQHLQDDSMLLPNQNHFIPLPETKCRHPLFGSNFKKAIKVPKHIEQRLKDSEDVKDSEELSPEEERRQRKKLKKRLRESLKEEPMEVVTEQEIPSEVRKKAKKRKHEDVEEAPKKKKKKHNESSEVWDSAQAIEESLFNY